MFFKCTYIYIGELKEFKCIVVIVHVRRLPHKSNNTDKFTQDHNIGIKKLSEYNFDSDLIITLFLLPFVNLYQPI